MISSCSAGYTVHCMQLVMHVIEQPRSSWCYFPFVSYESSWMSCSQSSGEIPGSWLFVTFLPLTTIVFPVHSVIYGPIMLGLNIKGGDRACKKVLFSLLRQVDWAIPENIHTQQRTASMF